MTTKNLNESNGIWKGDSAGYFAIHSWVRTRKPKPELCERCKKSKPFDLANKSGKYKRDVKDYEWLCRSCHSKKHRRKKWHNKMFELRKRKGFQKFPKGLYPNFGMRNKNHSIISKLQISLTKTKKRRCNMVEGWCCRCKKKVEIKDPVESLTKKGTSIVKGKCPNCGTTVCRMGKLI